MFHQGIEDDIAGARKPSAVHAHQSATTKVDRYVDGS